MERNVDMFSIAKFAITRLKQAHTIIKMQSEIQIHVLKESQRIGICDSPFRGIADVPKHRSRKHQVKSKLKKKAKRKTTLDNREGLTILEP